MIVGPHGFGFLAPTSSGGASSFDVFDVVEGFEGSGLLSGWSVLNADGTIDADNTSRVYNGSKSLYIEDTLRNSPKEKIEWAPSELSGGGNPDWFQFFYNEGDEDAFGFAIVFKDSDGNDVCGYTSNNPEMGYYDETGFNEPTTSFEATDEWFRVRLDFDWANYTFDVTVEDPDTGEVADLATGAGMRTQKDIEKMVLVKFRATGPEASSKIIVWLDDVRFVKA